MTLVSISCPVQMISISLLQIHLMERCVQAVLSYLWNLYLHEVCIRLHLALITR